MNITLNSSSSSALSVSSAATGSAQKHKKSVIEDAAKALGMNAQDLVTELKDGKSLGDVADEKGVSRDTLASALKVGMPSDLQSSGKADEVAGKMIDEVGGPKGHGHGHGHGGPKGPPPASSDSSSSGVYGDSLTSSQQSTLTKLADLLGTDSAGLLNDLKSGASLSTMLTDKGVSEKQVAGVVQNGLLIDAKA